MERLPGGPKKPGIFATHISQALYPDMIGADALALPSQHRETKESGSRQGRSFLGLAHGVISQRVVSRIPRKNGTETLPF
jgi:hypothetical protein